MIKAVIARAALVAREAVVAKEAVAARVHQLPITCGSPMRRRQVMDGTSPSSELSAKMVCSRQIDLKILVSFL